MSETKTRRPRKRQLGQFMTPEPLARQLLSDLHFRRSDRVLEPSMGDGSFVIPLIESFLPLYTGSTNQRLAEVLGRNVFGVEIDRQLYAKCLARIESRWGPIPEYHNFELGDFFRSSLGGTSVERQLDWQSGPTPGFSYIVGNPPFGGTLDPDIQDLLDRKYGFRNGEKIKKETYSFFIVKCLDLLRDNGVLRFICSDTFLTIRTMRGLRRLLMDYGETSIKDLAEFSEETQQPTIVLDFRKNGKAAAVEINGQRIGSDTIELTDNLSWRITPELTGYFQGPRLAQYVVATSGMTVGKNEYFVRRIENEAVSEPYRFEYYEDPVTLKKELARARLGKLSPGKTMEIRRLEAVGATKRNVRIVARKTPKTVKLPHPDYSYYNKATNGIVYAPPSYAIYWKDDGDAVLTFKKNGNWYLHGVGGQRYFKRSGLTWQLIAPRLNVKYLPEGYVLDSGAPCAFLREGIAEDESYFILGWTLTPLCSRILKQVINHTKNIQSKDFERLPYPFWVSSEEKEHVIRTFRGLVRRARHGERFTRASPEVTRAVARFNSIHAAHR